MIPRSAKLRIRITQDFPRWPAKDLEEGLIHRLEPIVGIASVQNYFSLRVSLAEVCGEEAAGHIENALQKAQHCTVIDLQRAPNIEVACHLIKFSPAPWLPNMVELGSHGIVPKTMVVVEDTIKVVVRSKPELFQRIGQGCTK